jgi:hypothetical protein
VSAWVDSILSLPIIVRGEIDPKCFVDIDNIVEHHKLCNVRWFNAETIEKKSTNQMTGEFMIETLRKLSQWNKL